MKRWCSLIGFDRDRLLRQRFWSDDNGAFADGVHMPNRFQLGLCLQNGHSLGSSGRSNIVNKFEPQRSTWPLIGPLLAAGLVRAFLTRRAFVHRMYVQELPGNMLTWKVSEKLTKHRYLSRTNAPCFQRSERSFARTIWKPTYESQPMQKSSLTVCAPVRMSHTCSAPSLTFDLFQ